ncbi:hypothetical protein HY837_04345 [archaeon]|nr:hypothetical protein [archaeon]
MNKKFYLGLLFFLLIAVACKPAIKMQKPEVQENSAVSNNVEEVGEDLSDFEKFNEDLNVDELDSLDKDLDDVEKLKIE